MYRTVALLLLSRGLQRDAVYLGWPIAPSYMSQNAGVGRRGVAGSQPMSNNNNNNNLYFPFYVTTVYEYSCTQELK
jgi:hypothetical protein